MPGEINLVEVETPKQARSRKREERRVWRIARRERLAGRAITEIPKTKPIDNGKVASKKARREAPDPLSYPEKTDGLVMYDRHKNLIGHALQNYWWPSPAAFLICGGPSLLKFDLEPLRERGVMSLGVNNVAALAPVRAMCFSDPPEKFHNGIFLDGAILKFVPVSKLSKRIRIRNPDTRKLVFSTANVNHCPSVFAYRKDARWRTNDFLTADCATLGSGKDCPLWQSRGSKKEEKIIFTFFVGIRLLHYLGIRNVYLLGVDFSMDASRGYAFQQKRNEGMAMGNNRYYRDASRMLKELKPIFEAADFHLFNVNPDSHLTVFDYVPFEAAVSHCRHHMPKHDWEWNTSDWYEKAGAVQELDDRGEDE